jgi:hypothetical protein
VQRHSIKLGSFYDQHPGWRLVLEDTVATPCAGRLGYSAGYFTKWVPHPCDWPSLRECRATDDSQYNPPPRWAGLFRAFADSTFGALVVAAQGRDPDSLGGIALSCATGRKLLPFIALCL